VIPLRDVIPSRTFPFVTITIIVLNALAWILELSLSPEDLERFLFIYGVVPANFHLPTLFTSMFLHGSWSHILGNMWYLWIFGDNVEDQFGHGRFVVFYVLCGVAAAFGHMLLNAGSMLPTIGASGAIAGVMGAYFIMYPHSRVLTLVPIFLYDVIEVPAIALLGFWFLMQLFSAGAVATATSGTGGGVAFAAHVAGFLVGMGGVFVFRKRDARWEIGG
jgi:membrane associated rhomboid family serine protease